MGKKEVRLRRLVVDALYSFSYVVGKPPFSHIERKVPLGPVPFVWYKTSLNGANRVVVVVVPFFFRPKRDALRVERVGTLVFASRFAETHHVPPQFLSQLRNQKQQREDQRSRSRGTEEGSMSPMICPSLRTKSTCSRTTSESRAATQLHLRASATPRTTGFG